MAGRILITGDKHGTFLPLFGLAEKNTLSPADILLIAGDAGYVWDADYAAAVESLEQLFPGVIAFIDGNHENHALLNGMETRLWNGGRVHAVGARVLHLMRGEVYTIYGKTFFVCGGARSVDRDRRVEGVSWWREEEPTAAELAYGREQLLRHRDEIEYVLTHDSPLHARAQIARRKPIAAEDRLPAVLEEWYDLLRDAPRFRRWYFGHMHVDQEIEEKLRAVYHDILEIGTEEKLRW